LGQDHKRTALIIEDEYLVATDLKSILEDLGFNVVAVATTEDDAVEAALQYQPALVTADVTLREGNGIQAVQRISREHCACVIYVTADGDKVKASAGDAICVAKPFDVRRIANAIEESMGTLP
jgi:DNA-binding response OmpR family regulator